MTDKTYRVEEKSDVLQDYIAITKHIEGWTGDRAAADRTVDAIRDFIKSLKSVPHRGTKRDDLLPGLRIVPFKKRTAIAIMIEDGSGDDGSGDEGAGVVTVLRVFYGGQDYDAVLGRPPE